MRMIEKQEFLNKYYGFLGYENKEKIVMSANRNILINGKFNYPIIATCIGESVIISISPLYYKKFKRFVETKNINKENIMEVIKCFSEECFSKSEVKEMYRLYKKDVPEWINNQIVNKITEKNKQNFFNIVKKENNIEYKEKKWKEFKSIKSKYRVKLWNYRRRKDCIIRIYIKYHKWFRKYNNTNRRKL